MSVLAGRRREDGKVPFRQIEIDVDAVGDFLRDGDRVGMVGKRLVHLFGRADEELVSLHPHPLGVAPQSERVHAQAARRARRRRPDRGNGRRSWRPGARPSAWPARSFPPRIAAGCRARRSGFRDKTGRRRRGDTRRPAARPRPSARPRANTTARPPRSRKGKSVLRCAPRAAPCRSAACNKSPRGMPTSTA